MRHLFTSLLLGALATQARADRIEYKMTGVITSTSVGWSGPSSISPPPSPFAAGDHVTWTLQLDPSTPASSSGNGSSSYSPTSPLITNLVDQTTGNTWLTSSYAPPPFSQSSLKLSSSASSSSLQAQSSSHGIDTGFATELNLGFNGSLPVAQLANLQLNSLPLNAAGSSLKYNSWSAPGLSYTFTASVDSISAPVNAAPEPASLTLFLLGGVGLTLRRLRPKLLQGS